MVVLEVASMEGTVVNWRGVLPGECRLARQVLPYLVRFHEQWMSAWNRTGFIPCSLVEIYDHDYYMCIHAIVGMMMALSIRMDDISWLEDRELMILLRGLEVLRPYSSDGKWMERCMAALSKANVALMDLLKSWDVEDRMESVWAPVEEGGGGGGGMFRVAARVARVVDGCKIQMLKDVFYLVVGRKTCEDCVSPGEKWGCTESIPLNEREVLCWPPWCPVMDSVECQWGDCSHWTGLLPVIGELEG